jgi:hypothetical protein
MAVQLEYLEDHHQLNRWEERCCNFWREKFKIIIYNSKWSQLISLAADNRYLEACSQLFLVWMDVNFQFISDVRMLFQPTRLSQLQIWTALINCDEWLSFQLARGIFVCVKSLLMEMIVRCATDRTGQPCPTCL